MAKRIDPVVISNNGCCDIENNTKTLSKAANNLKIIETFYMCDILEVLWYDTMDILIFFKYNKSLTGITISLSN